MPDLVVVDASAIVELLLDSALAPLVSDRLRNRDVHVPSHFDAEVLSAIGRMHRAGVLSAADVESFLARLSSTPLDRHLLPPLLAGAWHRRGQLRLVDALYIELGVQLDAAVITTDGGIAAADPRTELVSTI